MSGKDLFLVVLAGFILWQLVTGKVVDRWWETAATREDEPGKYWLYILGQSLIWFVVLLFFGEGESRLEPFDVVMLVAAVLAMHVVYRFFNSAASAQSKRTVLLVATAAVGVGLLVYAWYEDIPVLGLVGVAAVTLFFSLAMYQCASFCPECNKASWKSNFWSRAASCAKCGADLTAPR